MKRIITFIAVACMAAQAFALSFAYTYQGQTLYYNIDENGNAVVSCEIFPDPQTPSYTNLTGALTIPDSVTYNGATYPVTSIGMPAFFNCSGLTSVTIGAGVTSIGNYAFYGCSGLTSVDIPDGITSIGNAAFAYCSGLTSVTIPDGVTYIDYSTFAGCSGLTSVTIPDGVSCIGYHAFYNCSGLTTVTIGSGVTSIGKGAFYGCSGLTEIHSLANPAPVLGTDVFSDVQNSTDVFYDVQNTIPVYIPCGSLASYYSRWSYFSNFIEEEGFSFNAESADNNMGTVQILTMPTCTAPNAVIYAVPNSGYRFDHWSSGSTDNPYSLTVTTDTVLTAYFVSEGGTEGIEEVGEQESDVKVYTENGRIVVEGAEGETVRVLDMVGRPVGTHSLPAGVYMVRIGDLPARRVVVIR